MTNQWDGYISSASRTEEVPEIRIKTGQLALWWAFRWVYPKLTKHAEMWARLIQVEVQSRLHALDYVDDRTPEAATQIILEVADRMAIAADPSWVETARFIFLSGTILARCWEYGDVLLQWLDNSRYSEAPSASSAWVFPVGNPCNPCASLFLDWD